MPHLSKPIQAILSYAKALSRMIVPHVCPICRNALVEGEELLCLDCYTNIPRTNIHLKPDNILEQKLTDLKIPVERAAAFFYYKNDNPYSRLIRDAKYNGLWRNNVALAHLYARELRPVGFFDNIDYLIHVPIHWTKQLRRGYNQTHYIAQGISDITGIPIADNLKATKPHRTQTKRSASQRTHLSTDIFQITHPETLQGKHILLIDDVITTGSTILTCATHIHAATHTPLSILSLCIPTR